MASSSLFSVTVALMKGSKRTLKLKNKLEKINTSLSFKEIVKLLIPDIEEYKECTIELRRNEADINVMSTDETQLLTEVLEFNSALKYISYILIAEDDDDTDFSVVETRPKKDAFSVLMKSRSTKKYPRKKSNCITG